MATENNIPSPTKMVAQPAPEEPHLFPSDHFHIPRDCVEVSDKILTQFRRLSASEEQTACLTVQPNRILCGVSVQATYFIYFSFFWFVCAA